MKIKAHNIFIVVAFLAMTLLSGSCAKLSQVSVTSVALESVSPKGFRAATVSLNVGVHNPAARITLSDISGELMVSGKVIGKVAMPSVVLAARTDSTYRLTSELSLADGVSLMQVLALAGQRTALDQATANINATVKVKGGLVKKVKMEDVPVKELLEHIKK